MTDERTADSERDVDSNELPSLSVSRRRLLQTTGGLGVGGLISAEALSAQEAIDGNVIELDAVRVEDEETPGKANNPKHVWEGVAPAEIAGEVNPTLALVAGEEYTVEWTNTDGHPQNFTIVDADGKKLHKSEVLAKKGATQTVTFTATEEMAEYYSQTNRHDMRGAIQVGSEPPLEVDILVFSATAGYRHGNIEYGLQQLQGLEDRIAAETNADSVTIDTIPEDASAFPSNVSGLEQYDTIVWFNTTGDVLNADQQAAFEQYIQNGGGYAGIHAAADTEYDWGFYGDLLGGAYFEGHPAVQEAEIHVTDQTHPSTEHLPDRWIATDEWYDYAENPRGDVHVLATLDEDSYTGAAMSRADHPITWCREYRGGRAWYTGRGHTEAAFDEDAFLEHVLGGILWAGGFVEGDASGTVWSNYQKTQLTPDVSEPMKMDITPDGRLFYTERATGEVDIIHPDGEITTALSLDVYSEQEDGLQGIAFDPDFEENSWVYLYYSPPNDVVGDDPYNVLSRFEMEGDTIDPDSETEILRVHTQRETCCHVGGDIEFGPEGELYLSTGDDTNPFASSGYTPIDERSGTWPEDSDNAGIPHAYWDAQRTSGNTNDLRGSILRIIPQDDGSYEIPDGNLFTGDEYAQARENGLVREEIYVMGCRNPFTLTVDDETGLLYYADYGPDAGSWSADRGPNGIVEFSVVSEAQNAGWPYVCGPNIPYVDYDFETGESGEPFDAESLVNESPNNTGLAELPPVTEATIYYPNDWDEFINDVPEYAQEYVPDQNPWPSIPAGGAPMAGPVYRSVDGGAEAALPRSFDGKWFIMEWGSDWLKYVTFDQDGNVLDVAPFLPNYDYNGPMDFTVGPNGVLYLMEYGEGFFGGTDPGIYRIDHLAGLLGSDALSFALDDETLSSGETTTATTTLENLANTELTNVQFTLTADSDQIQISTSDQTSFDSVAPGESQSVTWQVTPSEEITGGEYNLNTQVTYVQDGNESQLQESASLRVAAPLSIPYGLDSGGEDHDENVSIGELTLDKLPNPSVTQTSEHSVSSFADSSNDIEGTENDLLYKTEHYGPDIGYDIFVPNGTYDVTLHFVELWWGVEGRGGTDAGEGSRVFDVAIQGETVLSNFDIYAEVGSLTATTKTIQDVEVTDEVLSISSTTQADNTKFSGIEIRPAGDNGDNGAIDPSTTIGLDAFIDGWEGTAPDGIGGQTNPTLTLSEGSEYTVEWTNADGAPHDFVLQDADGNDLDGTDIVSEEGAVVSLTFTATTDMAQYICTVHPSSMVGDVEVV